MPSPFPGMDPYLEDPSFWPDVHNSLATYVRDEIHPFLGDKYCAHVGERVYIGEYPEARIPDVSVARPRVTYSRHQPSSSDGAVGLPAVADASVVEADPPEIVLAPKGEIREGFVRITQTGRGGRVVTIIEILSPSNKLYGSEGYAEYRRKQQEVLDSDTHLIEIDLLRAGFHTCAVPRDCLPPPRDFDYLVCTSRAPHKGRYEVLRRTIRERLPRIAVPLAGDDPDVVLDLQKVFDRCYEFGGYGQIIDYSEDPPTPVRDADRDWVTEVLSASSV